MQVLLLRFLYLHLWIPVLPTFLFQFQHQLICGCIVFARQYFNDVHEFSLLNVFWTMLYVGIYPCNLQNCIFPAMDLKSWNVTIHTIPSYLIFPHLRTDIFQHTSIKCNIGLFQIFPSRIRPCLPRIIPIEMTAALYANTICDYVSTKEFRFCLNASNCTRLTIDNYFQNLLLRCRWSLPFDIDQCFRHFSVDFFHPMSR